MRTGSRSRTWWRAAALLAGPLLLAGCATPYALVQPDVAGSGSYYTGTGAYAGPGYYGGYANGPSYYPGTTGFGYYGGYNYWPGYSYWPGYGFTLGLSSGWGYPGYGWPWYTTVYTGCHSWRCHGHHHHDGNGSGHDGEPKAWLKPDRPRVPPRVVRNSEAPPTVVRSSPVARRPFAPTERPQRFIRAPGPAPAAGERIQRRVPPSSPDRGRFINARPVNPTPRIAVPPRARPVAPVRTAPASPPPRATPPPTVIRHVQPAPPVRPARPSRNTPATSIR